MRNKQGKRGVKGDRHQSRQQLPKYQHGEQSKQQNCKQCYKI